jgi:hypothetical protein
MSKYIRILTRRSLASNWSSVDEDLRAQVKARRVSDEHKPGEHEHEHE